MRTYSFFLGGRDLEMQAIAEMVSSFDSAELHDRRLAWGARASTYAVEIRQALAAGRQSVLVELQDDLPASFPRASLHWVDHHNERAGQHSPTSLEQVFELLKLPRKNWTRELELIAANDRGHVAAMLRLSPPATIEELRRIREADRTAQGITAEEERQGAEAIEQTLQIMWHGTLTLVELPHERTATVTDRLEQNMGGPGFQNLLVICPQSFTFYGSGPAISALLERWPAGYYGGELPQHGFFGRAVPTAVAEILAVLKILVSESHTP